MDRKMRQRWQAVLRIGFVTGIIILYTGMIGMIELFHEREIIEDLVTLGQLLLFIPPVVAGYFAANRILQGEGTVVEGCLSGLLIGLLAVISTAVLLFLNGQVIDDIRSVLVNVNNDWVEIVTFDHRDEQTLGVSIFLRYALVFGLGGGVLAVLPTKLRNAIVAGLSVTMTIAIFGETARLISQEIFPDDVLDEIFQRDTFRQQAAGGLLVITLVGGFFWSFFSKPLSEGYKELPDQSRTFAQYMGWVLLLVFLIALPLLIGRSLSDAAVTVGLFVMMGFGLNIAIGLAGLLDLGYVTNYAVGAYVMAVLTSTGPLGRGEFSFWMVIPVTLVAAMITGFIFAVPVLKMRGDYLAIATLGFGEIIGKLAISDWLKPLIGGAQGVLFIPKPNFFGTELKNPEQLYYIVLVACIVILFVSNRLNNSRTGRQWMAVREDEDVASAMGINVARAKLLAFTLSAATGGVAGGIFAAKVGSVFPNSFTVFISINVLSLIIVGGMGSNPGIVIGAIVLVGMPEFLREFAEYRWLLYGVLLIVMMVNRPQGLFPSQVRKREILGDKASPPKPAEQGA